MSSLSDPLPKQNESVVGIVGTSPPLQPSLGQLDKFPPELLIYIASNCYATDLLNLGQVNSVFLKLIFNQTRERIEKALIPFKLVGKTLLFSPLMLLNQVSIANEYRKDESFDNTQQQQQQHAENTLLSMSQESIWRPLVCHYFPKFNHSELQVKNWMHLLRKRIAHLQVNSPHHLPLRKYEPIKKPKQSTATTCGEQLENNAFIVPPIPVYTPNDEDQNPYEIGGIENCEWIYKCPMSFESMVNDDGEKKFCNQCGKHVYRVYNQKDVEIHSKLGHCISLVESLAPIVPVLGVPIWIPPPVQ